MGWLRAIYALGAVVLLARLLLGRRALAELGRRSAPVEDREWTALLDELRASAGIERRVRLLRAPSAVAPVTWGTRRPVILVPAEADAWPVERRRAVLLHELAYVARRDCLTQTLALVASAVYWFHPGAWWVARRLHVERELACDDRVLAAGTSPEDYARHLLEIARELSLPRPATYASGISGPAQLETRMRAILGAPGPRRCDRAGAARRGLGRRRAAGGADHRRPARGAARRPAVPVGRFIRPPADGRAPARRLLPRRSGPPGSPSRGAGRGGRRPGPAGGRDGKPHRRRGRDGGDRG
jgi:hypothetical protein